MIKRLFSSQSKTITGAAIILGAASFLSRIVGVIRDRIFAHHFGAGEILDAYYAAFRIPDLVFNLLIAGALSAGFIPVFLKIYHQNKKKAWEVTSSVLNIILISFILVCTALFIFTPQLMKFVVPGFSGEKLQTTITLTRIMFLSPILLSVSSVISSVLHSFKNFVVFAISPILYNFGIITGAVFLVPILGISGLAWGVVLGAMLHVSIQIPAIRHYGFKYQLITQWKDPLVRKIGKLIIPRTLGLATVQMNMLIITVIASTMAVGSIAVFNFANNLQYFAVGLIGHSFAIAAFPTLAKLAAENKYKELVANLSLTIRQIVFFIVPVTVVFLLLRAQIVRVVLGSGQFGWEATILTADTLAFFVLSLFAQCLILVLARAFYAIHDTWTPFLVSLGAVILNLFLSLYLKDIYGVQGLAFAFSISMTVQFAVMWLFLRRKIGTLNEYQMLNSLYKISISAMVMAVIVQYAKIPLAQIVDMTRFWGILIQGFIAGTIGLLVYGALTHLLRVEEMQLFQKSLRRRWLRFVGSDSHIKT